jgi:hypothetical protein
LTPYLYSKVKGSSSNGMFANLCTNNCPGSNRDYQVDKYAPIVDWVIK